MATPAASAMLLTNAVTESRPIELPSHYWSVCGLLCASADTYTNNYGTVVAKGINLAKFSTNYKTNEAGELVSKLIEPKYPFRLTIEEAEQLKDRIDFMLQAIRTANREYGDAKPSLIATMARNAHWYERSVSNKFDFITPTYSPVLPSGYEADVSNNGENTASTVKFDTNMKASRESLMETTFEQGREAQEMSSNIN